METKQQKGRHLTRRKQEASVRKVGQAGAVKRQITQRSRDARANAEDPPSHDGWRSFGELRCKGISLTLGLPFATVLVALVLTLADWNKIGGHIDIPAFLGSFGTIVLATLQRAWKRK
jgi:hypothetical protein